VPAKDEILSRIRGALADAVTPVRERFPKARWVPVQNQRWSAPAPLKPAAPRAPATTTSRLAGHCALIASPSACPAPAGGAPLRNSVPDASSAKPPLDCARYSSNRAVESPSTEMTTSSLGGGGCWAAAGQARTAAATARTSRRINPASPLAVR